MSKVLRMSDRIKVKIGSLEFKLAPLSYLHKQELANCTRLIGGEEHYDLLRAQTMYLKYSVKGVSGLKQYDGSPYELELENDQLTEESLSELMNVECKEQLTVAAWQLLNGIKELKDPVTGTKLKGVKIEVEAGGK